MTVYRQKVKVLPGGKIQVDTPDLETGKEVEIELTVTDPAQAGQGQDKADDDKELGVWDFIKSLPPGPRGGLTFEEIERSIQEERDSWDF